MDNLHTVECEGADAVALSPDGALIALARSGPNGAALVKADSSFVAEIDGTSGCAVAAVTWAGDGSRVVAAGRSADAGASTGPPRGFICACDTKGHRVFAVLREAPVEGVGFAPDEEGTRLACARADGIVEVMNGINGDVLQRVRLRGFKEMYDHRAPFAGISPARPAPPRPPTTPTPCVAVCYNAYGDKLVVAREAQAVIVDLNMAPVTPFGQVGMTQEQLAAADEAADDTQTVVRELALSCGSKSRAVASTLGECSDEVVHYVAVCGGARVRVAVIDRMGTGKDICDRALEQAGAPWVAALAVAFCASAKGPRLVVGGAAPAPTPAQKALARAKAKVKDLLDAHEEVVQQLFHAERAILEWKAYDFMQEPEEKDEDEEVEARLAAAAAAPAPAAA